MISPQGLCTCYSACLGCSSAHCHSVHFLTSFKPLHKWHFLREPSVNILPKTHLCHSLSTNSTFYFLTLTALLRYNWHTCIFKVHHFYKFWHIHQWNHQHNQDNEPSITPKCLLLLLCNLFLPLLTHKQLLICLLLLQISLHFLELI